MKAISRTMLQPHRYIYKHFYSTSNDKKGAKVNLELSDILTEDEIEFEVSENEKFTVNFARSKSNSNRFRSKRCVSDFHGTELL